MKQVPYDEIKDIGGTEPIEKANTLDRATRTSPEGDREIHAFRYNSTLNGQEVIGYRIAKKLDEERESVLEFCLSLDAANALVLVTSELLNRRAVKKDGPK